MEKDNIDYVRQRLHDIGNDLAHVAVIREDMAELKTNVKHLSINLDKYQKDVAKNEELNIKNRGHVKSLKRDRNFIITISGLLWTLLVSWLNKKP